MTLHWFSLDDRPEQAIVCPRVSSLLIKSEYGARDGIAIHGQNILRIEAIEDAELVMVDSA